MTPYCYAVATTFTDSTNIDTTYSSAATMNFAATDTIASTVVAQILLGLLDFLVPFLYHQHCSCSRDYHYLKNCNAQVCEGSFGEAMT